MEVLNSEVILAKTSNDISQSTLDRLEEKCRDASRWSIMSKLFLHECSDGVPEHYKPYAQQCKCCKRYLLPACLLNKDYYVKLDILAGTACSVWYQDTTWEAAVRRTAAEEGFSYYSQILKAVHIIHDRPCLNTASANYYFRRDLYWTNNRKEMILQFNFAFVPTLKAAALQVIIKNLYYNIVTLTVRARLSRAGVRTYLHRPCRHQSRDLINIALAVLDQISTLEIPSTLEHELFIYCLHSTTTKLRCTSCLYQLFQCAKREMMRFRNAKKNSNI